MSRPFSPRALGEIAVRCTLFSEMVAFYRDEIGLTVLPDGDRGGIVFFDLGPSHGGHRQVLALFDHGIEGHPVPPVAGGSVDGPRSTLHHIALALSHAEQEAAEAWLRERGHPTRWQEFGWIGWRGLFTRDPDGNTVELVAAVPGGTS